MILEQKEIQIAENKENKNCYKIRLRDKWQNICYLLCELSSQN